MVQNYLKFVLNLYMTYSNCVLKFQFIWAIVGGSTEKKINNDVQTSTKKKFSELIFNICYSNIIRKYNVKLVLKFWVLPN